MIGRQLEYRAKMELAGRILLLLVLLLRGSCVVSQSCDAFHYS